MMATLFCKKKLHEGVQLFLFDKPDAALSSFGGPRPYT